MENDLRKRNFFAYLIITFAITYTFWGFDAILSRLGLYEHPAYNIGILFYIIAACSPAIATYILLQKEPDKRGMRNYVKFSFRFDRPVIEILLIVIFLSIRFGVPFLFGDGKIIGDWWQVVLFIPIMVFFGGFEEIGWRGYLQPILDNRFGAVCASLVNCAIWTVWHLPLCFIKGTYQNSGNYLWFIVSLIGSAFSLAAINKVHGSIMPCILFHAAGNAIVSYGITGNEGLGMVVSTCIQVLFAISVFKRYSKEPGLNVSREQPAEK